MKLFSPGKLLLTSEYVVLDGALALAVPTKLGQECLFFEQNDQKSLVYWKAYHEGKIWLEAIIDYKNLSIVASNLPEPAKFVLKLISKVKELSETVFAKSTSYTIETYLQFPSNFGLGSSSTLMNNIAEWAGIDSYLLNDEVLGGSGYDIAVAKYQKPLLFHIENKVRKADTINFDPTFKEELIFIHLNQKQDSREGIRLYRGKTKTQKQIHFFSEITRQVVETQSLEEFSRLMTLHENRLSNLIELPTVKQKFFADAPVFFKSLGAWGGDFVMSQRFEGYENYLKNKGFSTFFSYVDLIL